MILNEQDEQCELPAKIGKPALRALKGAGYVKLEQFTKLSEKELLKLHGVGPKAISILRLTLEERGLSFANEK